MQYYKMKQETKTPELLKVNYWKWINQDLSGSWCIKETDESTLVMDSLVLLMHHEPDRSWVTVPDPDHIKGTHHELRGGSSAIIFKFPT